MSVTKTKPQMLVLPVVAKNPAGTTSGSKQKKAALIRQANSWHQMKETKQLKPPQNPKRLPTCKHKVEKRKEKHTHKKHHQITTV